MIASCSPATTSVGAVIRSLPSPSSLRDQRHQLVADRRGRGSSAGLFATARCSHRSALASRYSGAVPSTSIIRTNASFGNRRSVWPEQPRDLPQVRREPVGAGHQHQPVHPARVVLREPLRDRAAQRHAHHVGPVELELVHQLRDVGARYVRFGAGLRACEAERPMPRLSSRTSVKWLARSGHDGVPQAACRPETRNEQAAARPRRRSRNSTGRLRGPPTP